MRRFISTILLLAGIFCFTLSHADEVSLYTDSAGNKISLLKNASIIDLGNDLIEGTFRISLAKTASDVMKEQLALTAPSKRELDLAQGVSHITLRMAFRISVPMAKINSAAFLACGDNEIRTIKNAISHSEWHYVTGDLLRLAQKTKQSLGVRRPFTYDNDYLAVHKAGDRAVTYYTIPERGERFCSTPVFTVINKPAFISASQFFDLLALKDSSLLASCSRGNQNSCSIYERSRNPLKTLDAPTRCLFTKDSYSPHRQPGDKPGWPVAGLSHWVAGSIR